MASSCSHVSCIPVWQIVVTLNPTLDQAKLAEKELVHVFGNVHTPTGRELGVELYKHLTPLLEAGDIKVGFLLGVRLAIVADDKYP